MSKNGAANVVSLEAGLAVGSQNRLRENRRATLREEVAGDPIDGTRWTRKTTQSIAQELRTLGIEVSANTVGRLLRQMRFSLKTNRKNIESGFRHKRGDRARRNRQFVHINAKCRKFETADLPIISCDGKKRELIGAMAVGAALFAHSLVAHFWSSADK